MQKGERFLRDMFDPAMDLLPEYEGANVYWLYHDNYLAEKLLESTEPELAERIRKRIRSFGVDRSGKIEIVFGESKDPLPFKQYLLVDVANVGNKVVRTEKVTPRVMQGWEQYADLLCLAILAAPHDPHAGEWYQRLIEMWDGKGFVDPAFKQMKIYATYKLALAMLASQRLGKELPFEPAIVQRLESLQNDAGGWITDYTPEGKPHGLANVETTCLVLLALKEK